MFIKNAWYVAAWPEELSTAPVARRLLGEPVVLFRDAQGHAAALADMCCHRGAPLSRGTIVDAGLECGYHGLIFGGDGTCVHIPGQVHIPPKARVRSYPVSERDGLVWIWMGDPAAADTTGIVAYPFHNDTAHWPHKKTLITIDGSATLMIDNLMDLSHLGYIHRSTIGGGGSAQAHSEALMDTQPGDDGLKFTRWQLNVLVAPTYKRLVPTLSERIDRWAEFEFTAPGVVTHWVGGVDANTGAYDKGMREGGVSMRVFHGLTPETETSCHYFYSVLNGTRPDDPQTTDAVFTEVNTAFLEDKAMVQAQQARLTEFGETELINIHTDGARMHMRRILEKLLAREAGIALTN